MLFKPTGTTPGKGQQAEIDAERFLQQQGLRSLCRNFRCKAGEIDLIMQDGDTLVFIEVRLRSNPFFASAAESVTWKKQQKIIRAAHWYLLQNTLSERVPCRFDVIALRGQGHQPDWIKNAFGAN